MAKIGKGILEDGTSAWESNGDAYIKNAEQELDYIMAILEDPVTSTTAFGDDVYSNGIGIARFVLAAMDAWKAKNFY